MNPYHFHGYTPHQRDLVSVNFDPSVGREIRKRRPALVISATTFNAQTGYVAICPITSTIRNSPGFIDLHAHQLSGQIVALQFRTIDFISAQREIQYIEQASAADFMKVAQVIHDSLGFDEVISNL
ncbi:type II toxin-antitoxin system PemK/MazF family toxin [Lapidilactobacillus mulanensis]|uniref:Type II toxin-antitoxin system PemK/MazF family toxin n=1 Tax=Lapidilactobacillus mulanensis TaxID=2485999 RepID=A0ABW4DMM2_9LACO|nr:type II toxin-antitoxin system PemK/MazF family toxin [Lapidilactobacillus mulanensis]